jgi:hypothetical protein
VSVKGYCKPPSFMRGFMTTTSKGKIPNEEIRSRMDGAIRIHNKLLLIPTEHSVASTWFKYAFLPSEGRE